MINNEPCSWVMRVKLYLPNPDEMPNEMLEIAAAISWVNYRVEGPGCLWLMVNSRCEPKIKSGFSGFKDFQDEQSPI